MTSAETQSQRFHALDSLRAVMMLLGVVLHAACSYGVGTAGEHWPFRDTAVNPLCDVVVALIHSFRMPLFFVLAGFFAALLRERKGLGGMLKDRAARILGPLVVGWFLLFPLVSLAFVFAWQAQGTPIPERKPGDGLGLNTMHLWFLNFLVYFYLAASLMELLARRLGPNVLARSRAGFRVVAGHVFWRVVALGLITGAASLPTMIGALEPSTTLIPGIGPLMVQFTFFAFGWCLYRERDLLSSFGRWAWTQVAVAWLVVGPMCAVALAIEFRDPSQRVWAAHVAASVLGGWMVWSLIFGIAGLFLRHLDRPIPVMRYLTEASYWVYLVHLPLVVFLSGLIASWPLPALVKLALVLAAAVPLLLVSYHLVVRSSWVGRALNGRRHPFRLPGWPVREPAW